jgi:hypothetical protein
MMVSRPITFRAWALPNAEKNPSTFTFAGSVAAG